MSQIELQARLAELDSERSEILKQLGQEDVVEAAKNALATAALAAGAATAATKVVEKAVEEEEDDEVNAETEVFAVYKPLVTGGSAHPTALCASTNLSEILKVEIINDIQSYLHDAVSRNTALSDAQLEAIALARRRNAVDQLAFVCGDATGVGKTRILLGCIQNSRSFSGANTRALIISVGNLFDDFAKDAASVGLKGKICNGGTLNKKKDIEILEKSLFVSHDVVRTFGADKLLRWLLNGKKKTTPGKEVLLVVDEAHRFGNKSKRGAQMKFLLNMAHAAGVHIVLASATIASSVPQLELLSSVTGLVRNPTNPDHPVTNFRSLSSSLRRLGEAGLVCISTQLRSSGGYIARSLSMIGCEFESIAAPLSTVDSDRYTACAKIWADLFATGAFENPIALGVYHSASLRFFKNLTMLIRLPTVISIAIDSLEAGCQVILTTLSTDEASISRSVAVADDDDDDTGDVSLGGAEENSRLKNGALLDNILQVVAFVRKQQDQTSSVAVALTAVERMARELNLPVVGPLDIAKHRLARFLDDDRSKIAELTGRKKVVFCKFDDDVSDKNNWTVSTRGESLLEAKARFQTGSARVALLSAAASTGASLHDVNGARRVVIALELPYSATQFIQTTGRAHRAGQKSAPKIFLVTCPDVAAESRFASAIASRLSQLGAITVADRRGGTSVDFGSESQLVCALANKAAATVGAMNKVKLGSVPTSIQLMNRCLAMAPVDGNKVMKQFTEEIDKISKTKPPSTRIVDFEVGGNTTEIKSFERPGGTGSLVKTFKVDNGVSFETATLRVSEDANRFGIYSKDEQMFANSSPIVMADKTFVNGKVLLTRPNGAKSVADPFDFERVYTRLDPATDSSRLLWEKWWNRSNQVCSHGNRCKIPGCEVGMRTKTSSIVTFPILDCVSYARTVKLVRIIDSTSSTLGMRVQNGVVKSFEREAEKKKLVDDAAAAAAAVVVSEPKEVAMEVEQPVVAEEEEEEEDDEEDEEPSKKRKAVVDSCDESEDDDYFLEIARKKAKARIDKAVV